MPPLYRPFFKRLSPTSSRGGVFFLISVNIGLGILALGSWGFDRQALAEERAIASTERTRELVRMVRQDCGSCHGLTLRGGLGPALLPETLRDRPPDGLKYTILLGRPGTAMPPWQPFLSEAEAEWIVAQLLRGFPEESR